MIDMSDLAQAYFDERYEAQLRGDGFFAGARDDIDDEGAIRDLDDVEIEDQMPEYDVYEQEEQE